MVLVAFSNVSKHIRRQRAGVDLCTFEVSAQEEGSLVEETLFSLGKGFCIALKALTLLSEGEER